jgi:hypothetical protein
MVICVGLYCSSACIQDIHLTLHCITVIIGILVLLMTLVILVRTRISGILSIIWIRVVLEIAVLWDGLVMMITITTAIT